MLIFYVISLASANILCSLALPHFPRDDPDTPNCGYQSCHPVKEGLINVHIVPHTHDDVGWLKTVDQYYFGAQNNIQRAGVQYIIDTVVDSLRRNKDRRFIYVELAFFWKWWQEQNDETRLITKALVNNGQLEFIGGGWSMNDEAATHYHSIIDQMTWGLRKLNDSFGECGRPKIGWQIDPFGHSKGMASIFALLGYDGFLLNRIDYQEMQHRRDTDSLEMIWRSSANLGEKSDIFTGILPKHYNAPPGFCFDVNCNDDPIIDDKKSPDNNVESRVNSFIGFLEDITSSGLTTSNVLITMGDDFTYQDAEMWFKNLDKLILHTNLRQENGSKFNVLYSTPSCYVKAVYDESKGNIEWPVKHDDFMPYASDSHSYWTGYYTSRPTLKRYEREGNNFLQVCKQLSVLTGVESDGLDDLREAIGIMQHHDAVTGTEKQAVASDYARIIAQGVESCESIVASALSQISTPLEAPILKADEAFVTCPLLNISQCAFSENNDNFIVTVYNPLSRPITKYIRLPVLGENYSVRNPNGENIDIQLNSVPKPLLNIPGRDSAATQELLFAAKNVPPLGYESYFVERTASSTGSKPTPKLIDSGVEVDGGTGLISQFRANNVTVNITQLFAYYDSAADSQRSSGAYVFRPTGDKATVSDSADFGVTFGDVDFEVHQIYNEWVSQVVRYYTGEQYLELEWLVGPLPDNGINGKEVVSLFKTDLNTDETFYTDSNGRELLKRRRNSRPTYEVNIQEEASGNYYPVTSKLVLRDEEQNIELAVLTDRAQGGSSLNDGEAELMVHRKSLRDDGFGVGEALNEQAYGTPLIAKGTHYIVVGPIDSSDGPTAAAVERDLAQRKLLDSWIFLSSTEDKSFEEYSAAHILKYEGLTRALPDNVQILTLEPWKDSSFLLRLEHVLEENEDTNLSKPVTVDLNQLFASFEIVSLEETTLGGNQWLKDSERLIFDEGEDLENLKDKKVKSTKQWTKEKTNKRSTPRDDVDNLQIDLNPMEIRTFVVTVQHAKL